MARKTIDVADLKATANRPLSLPTLHATQDEHMGAENARAFRQGIASTLESALMATGNYKGFRYEDGSQGRSDDSKRFYL